MIRRPCSRKIGAVLLLSAIALFMPLMSKRNSHLLSVKKDLERYGIAHVNLEFWNQNDSENVEIVDQDHSCRNHVPANLARTMSSLGQWAAAQQFTKRENKLQEYDHPNKIQYHETTIPNKNSPEKTCKNSFRLVSKSEKWALIQIEKFSRSPDIDISYYPSAHFFIAKEIEDQGSVWIFTDLIKWHHKLSERKRDGSTSSPWFIQAFLLSKENESTGNDFCNGMSMIMAMSGFQWSLLAKGDCLTYFVAKWKLNDCGKFQGAMMYSFLLALLIEGITAFQVRSRSFLKGRVRKNFMTFIYAIQQWLGYIVMLIAMMYSIELMACVLLGLMLGRALFPDPRHERREAARQQVNSTTQSTTPSEAEEEAPLLGGSLSHVRRRRR